MADINKTAGKVVYEYYFATQGASRMNVPKSLKPKPKKTSKMNLIMLNCSSLINDVEFSCVLEFQNAQC